MRCPGSRSRDPVACCTIPTQQLSNIETEAPSPPRTRRSPLSMLSEKVVLVSLALHASRCPNRVLCKYWTPNLFTIVRGGSAVWVWYLLTPRTPISRAHSVYRAEGIDTAVEDRMERMDEGIGCCVHEYRWPWTSDGDVNDVVCEAR